MDVALPRACRIRRRGGRPPSLSRQQLRDLRVARREPRPGNGGFDPRSPAERRALLSAPRCGAATRCLAHVARWRRRGAQGGQGGRRASHVRDVVSAAFARLRDQRPRLPAPRGSAVMEHLGRLLRPARARPLQALPAQHELVAVLDRCRSAARARGEHQHAHHPAQQLGLAHRRHIRPARHDVRRPECARRAGGAAGSVHRAVAFHRRQRPCTARSLFQRELVPRRRRTQPLDQHQPGARLQGVRTIQLRAHAELVAQRGGQPVVRQLQRCDGDDALHLRPSRPAHHVPHAAAELHADARSFGAGLHAAIHLQGDVLERA